MGSVHYHEDLVKEILLRLPVKSMVRFRCVAKTWRSLFQNPRFVSQHLTITKIKNKQLLVFSIGEDETSRWFYVPCLSLFLDPTLVSYQNLWPQKPQGLNFCVNDGIICIHYYSTTTLWNPATREFRELPVLPECLARERREIYLLGCGWDSSSNDLKVICMLKKTTDLFSQESHLRHYAVYRLSSNSWLVFKLVEGVEALIKHTGLYSNGICVNGVCYWLSFGNKVLAFDFGDQVFRFIDLPAAKRTPYMKRKLLPLPLPHHDKYRISLWISWYDRQSTDTISNEVWVLNDDGRSWSKLLSIGSVPGRELFGFWDGVSKVLIKSALGHLSLHDLDTKQVQDVETTAGKSCFLQVYTYEENVVPIKL